MSGTYDLEPVLLSSQSSYVKLSREERWALSAVRHVDHIKAPIAITVGDNESPEFKRQAARLFVILQEASKPTSFTRVPDCNHFEMMDVFADPNSDVAMVP